MSEESSYRLRIRGAQIVQVCASGEAYKAGEAQGQVRGLLVIVIYAAWLNVEFFFCGFLSMR
jgi:hypothetical protein